MPQGPDPGFKWQAQNDVDLAMDLNGQINDDLNGQVGVLDGKIVKVDALTIKPDLSDDLSDLVRRPIQKNRTGRTGRV